MKKVEVTINGRAYPCRMTMGAMLLFKERTGREATAIAEDSVSDMTVLVWCCIKSACRFDRIDFDISLEDFADGITPDEAATMFAVVNDGADTEEGEGKKKRSSRK